MTNLIAAVKMDEMFPIRVSSVFDGQEQYVFVLVSITTFEKP